MVDQNGDHCNMDAIRQFLLAAFSAEELRRFCLDHDAFRLIVHNFGPKYNLNDMVDEVLFYCEPRGLLDQLLATAQEINPGQYARFEGVLHDPGYSPPASAQDQPLLPLRKIGEFVKQAIVGDSQAVRALRNRQAMLQLVRNTWVKGVLEQSLHSAAMIELGMEERADAVERPWDMVVRMPGQPNLRLPKGTKIIDVFDQMNHSLLILGEPGSGKTTVLLDLARDSIDRAEQDPTQPIPVVFNLSSWAEKKGPIAEWLIEELRSKYYVGRENARAWVKNNDLLLLLDGLDEVKAELRNVCVTALNAFRQHSTQIVVCSRIADYELLAERLNLCGAVLLQPLTAQQINQYLDGAGVELMAVRRALECDPALRELAQTPVMLSIMILAYQGLATENFTAAGSVEDARHHLFTFYVQKMFERRRPVQPYTPEQAIHWLSWLARKMIKHARSVLWVEEMRPNWLDTRSQGSVYLVGPVLATALVFGLLGGLLGGLLNGLFVGLLIGLVVGLFVGLVGELVAGLLSSMEGGYFFGPTNGVVPGPDLPGYVVLQRIVLRGILVRSGHVPWRYARFLDYAAERIFLRKVGGGYIFVHRLLQEYFASLWIEEAEP
ncbi:MAG: NACHT domain-containing protein [Anaerolineae bacterium]|nr:NACHT domain-containing protein [Anaerolineae bacterium]